MLFSVVEGHHVASRRIIGAAIRAGTNAHVITLEPDANACARAENSGKWTIVNSKKSPIGNIGFLSSISRTIDELIKSVNVASQVKFSGCDLIHVLNITKEAYVIAHKLLRVKKPLLVHFYHSPYVLTDDVFLIRNVALRTGLYGRVLDNHVLTTNVSLYNFLVDNLGIDPERVHYAPYPVDTNTFKPSNNKESLREKHGLPPDQPIVVYVGSLNPARGISTLIRSFHNVLSRFPRALLYISHPHHKPEETYETQLRELVQNLKLQKNVLIVGPSPHVEEIYNLADVVVLPFRRPYWVDPPLVLLEAMSSGVPVVVTSVGAIGEVIRDHENALVIRPENPEILAEAIIELLENPRDSLEMGKRAHETIVQNYSYEVVGKKLLEIYDFVLDRS